MRYLVLCIYFVFIDTLRYCNVFSGGSWKTETFASQITFMSFTTHVVQSLNEAKVTSSLAFS